MSVAMDYYSQVTTKVFFPLQMRKLSKNVTKEFVRKVLNMAFKVLMNFFIPWSFFLNIRKKEGLEKLAHQSEASPSKEEFVLFLGQSGSKVLGPAHVWNLFFFFLIFISRCV